MQITSALLVEEVKKHPDGRVDLLGLFEDIYTPGVPAEAGRFCLFIDCELSERDRDARHRLELRLIDQDAQAVVPPLIVEFHIPGDEQYPRSTAQFDIDFPDVTFRRYGVHYIDVFLDGALARRVYLSVQPVLRAAVAGRE